MSAIISDCGKYRYRLERLTGRPELEHVVAFFGVNPSTADATEDDATIRKMIGFARRWGYSKIIVGNVFPFRSTDVRELAKCKSAIGDFMTHSAHLKAIAEDAHLLVPCWGSRGKVPQHLRSRLDATLRALLTTEKPMCHLGLTASGDPKHPLMLSYDTPLTRWAQT